MLVTKGANKTPNTLQSCSFISCFTVWVTPSVSKSEPSKDFIFLSNLFIGFEIKLLTNSGELSLATGIGMFVSAFLPKLPNQEPKDPPNWIILDVWVLLIFVSVHILFSKVFFILFVCLADRSN